LVEFPEAELWRFTDQKGPVKQRWLCILSPMRRKNGGTAVFIDAEHALDPVYARKLGVDVENLYISQPDYGEQALEIAEELSKSGAVDVIVIDSVAALVPKAELDGEIGDSFMGCRLD